MIVVVLEHTRKSLGNEVADELENLRFSSHPVVVCAQQTTSQYLGNIVADELANPQDCASDWWISDV